MKRLIRKSELLINPNKNQVENNFYFNINNYNVEVNNENQFTNNGLKLYFNNNRIDVLDNIKQEELLNKLYNAKNNLLNLFGNFNYPIYINNDKLEVGLLDILQDFNSAKTSLNQVSRIHTNTKFEPNTIVLDYGGGKFDKAVEYLANQGVVNLVYDPYNRSAEHNREVLDIIKENNGADYVVCANVLNVIKEESVIINVLEDLDKYCKSNGVIRICVYEGNKSNNQSSNDGKKTFQQNKKTKDYYDIINEVYGKKGYNITLKNNIYEIKK